MDCPVTSVNQNLFDEPRWKLVIGTGLAWPLVFTVYAANEQKAVDLVADYIEENKYTGIYDTVETLAEDCEADKCADDVAAERGLTCCGNHGIFIELLGVEKM